MDFLFYICMVIKTKVIMEAKVKALVTVLESENKDRKIAIDDKDCSRYNRRILTSKYSAIEETIKRLKEILE